MSGEDRAERAVAIVGVGAVLPDAPDAPTFWSNVKHGVYSIAEVPPERWDPRLYFDPDPKAPEKSYSKIGGFVRAWPWDPLAWRLPIPPRVIEGMDRTQRWAIVATREALADYGYPARPLDRERTAVILGNAMAGDKHYFTALRVLFPEVAEELRRSEAYAALPDDVQQALVDQTLRGVRRRLPEVNEDTMPGELANVIAGRVAAVFDLHGPNFICDAACASAMAALSAAVNGLCDGEFDAVISGGIDANMSASTYVKFCKIGALSGTGTRPYADGADGFVMGEGGAVLLLKRLADAERAGDRIYAVIRGFGGSSDGKGRGITAPNPAGQKLAIERAWKSAGLSPATATMIEGHGTSTRVGDAVEVESLLAVFGGLGLAPGRIALGSVKSNIGHLKGAAGAAGVLKAALSLHDELLPPSLGFERPNPHIDFSSTPFRVNTALRAWDDPMEGVRRAGVSAFGFGGTNFHIVLEEHVPGMLARARRTQAPIGARVERAGSVETRPAPLRGILLLGAETQADLVAQLAPVAARAEAGEAPQRSAPSREALGAALRLAIDHGDAKELAVKAGKALRAFEAGNAGMWRALRAQGIFLGRGAPGKLALLFTGQGSQYVNMLRALREAEPVVGATFAEADRVMTPLLGRPLSSYIFVDAADPAQLKAAEAALRDTQITQPAVLACDVALQRLLAAHGLVPDMVIGHSLGEYGALVASGAIEFGEALEAVSARGAEMSRVSVDDGGAMLAVFGPLAQIEAALATVDGYAVIANKNSPKQAVVGGSTEGTRRAAEAFERAGLRSAPLSVSHAFHTRIVAPASEPLRRVLARFHIAPPTIPLVSNVTGRFYPMAPDAVPDMIELLSQQLASSVEFVKGVESLYAAGARVFVECGPKRALAALVEEILDEKSDVLTLATNHPKTGDVVSFNHALAGLFAAGLSPHAATPTVPARSAAPTSAAPAIAPQAATPPAPRPTWAAIAPPATGPASVPVPRFSSSSPAGRVMGEEGYRELGKIFADALDRGLALLGRGPASPAAVDLPSAVVSGAGLGLPGGARVFDDENVPRLLAGEQRIGPLPEAIRRAMVERHVTRLVKSDEGARFEAVGGVDDVIKLAGRGGALDLVEEFGVPAERVSAYDVTTKLAVAVGIETLRDAGIPLAMRYKTTTRGTQLPERFLLPDALRDETGIIFGAAFPGHDNLAADIAHFYEERTARERLAELAGLRERLGASATPELVTELDRRSREIEGVVSREPYALDRRYVFRVLPMGHSQLAEYIGARGPNTHANAACASGTHAMTLAEDWIRLGRCRRVLVVTADDVTSDNLMQWIGSGFLASGAAATDAKVEDVALPFDRRRHGLVLGMGAAGMLVESEEAAAERGVAPICEILGTITANSAFHGSRLELDHIVQVMESLVSAAERRHGLDRQELARELVFVSHETYTPARGGSAQAEVDALRRVFGAASQTIVVANTKGYTGHAMGAGMEDVAAIKILESGIVPAVANHRELDPELGPLNLSRGGAYPVRYALRLGAGFGSQISMSLLRWAPPPGGAHAPPTGLGYGYRVVDPARYAAWLADISGYASPELEVVKRTLRIKDQGPPAPRRARVGGLPAASSAHSPAQQTAPQRPAVPAAPASSPPAPGVPAALPPQRAATTASPPAPAAVEALDPVKAAVVDIVSKQTGYPPEMLDVELDLEADLGVDTVKQAETFAAVREAYGIEREATLKLKDFPTLAHVIRWVKDKRPDLAAAAAPGPRTSATPSPALAPSPAAEPIVESADPVRDKVVAIVAEQTGYPPEMLDVELDLEADLGVDTVKQAETFAAVREAYGIEREATLKLKDFPTLAHVIRWVKERRPATRATEGPAASAPVAATTMSLPAGDDAAAAAVLRRIPVPVLRPPLDLCKPTGVVLDAGSRVLVMADAGGAAEHLVGRLRERGVEALELEADSDAVAFVGQIERARAGGRISGLFWLPALDDEGDPHALGRAAFAQALWRRVKLLYHAARALYDDLGAGGFVVAASRLGGEHGAGDGGATAALGGAVTGFVKTLARERPAALVKAVDFPLEAGADAVAEALLAETLADPGAVEIGRLRGLRSSLALAERPLADADSVAFGPESVYLVTGAAGSIVSAIVADLAKRGGTFYLLDLAPEPKADDQDVALFAADREAMKRTLVERARARGERVTPVMIDKELARLERLAAAASARAAIERAGGAAHYRQLDLRDGDAVRAVVDEVRERHGRIDVLVHAAGLEVSRFLPDKKPEEFDLVFDVKALGWHNMLSAVGDMPLGATVAFSSIAGRFGNAGQSDYAAGNDLLAKLAGCLRRSRPATRALVIDWTAWGGIGMATRGSIPKMMEAAGIDTLPPEAGIAIVGRELRAGSRGELLVAGRLGALTEEIDDTGGLDRALAGARARGPMVGRVVGAPLGRGVVCEISLDPQQQPFLRDHQIDGTAVLPGVMGLEGFAEVASLLAPGFSVAAIEDVRFLSPFKLYRGEPRVATLQALVAVHGADLVAHAALTGSRSLPGHTAAVVTEHFSGVVRLVRERSLAAPVKVPSAAPFRSAAVGADAIYRIYFHGPAYQVLDEVWLDGRRVVGRLKADLPPNHVPATCSTVLDPRLVELCFQTAGVWEIGTTGKLGLPAQIERVRGCEATRSGPRFAVVTPRDDGAYDAIVVDDAGALLVSLEGYRTVALGDVGEELRRPLAEAMFRGPA